MDIRDTIPSYVFPVEKGDNSPVFNVLQTIDRWTIGERPITDNPIPSSSARSPLEKQSEHSDGNKKVVTASEHEPYKIFRPWETESINLKETDSSSVIGKYVDLVPDVQKEKKIPNILEVTLSDVVADHITITSDYSKPETNITLNDSTTTHHGSIQATQDQDNILKTRKSFQHNYKELSKSTQRTKKKFEKIIVYDCNKFGHKVPEKSNLNKHKETHTENKPFARTRSDYRTDIISNCTRLTRAHTNIKHCAFKSCKYSTAIKGNLNTHMRIHTNEKPYACNECNYRAAKRSNLIIHMRIHTNEKPYACNECNYSAAQKIHLNRHMTIHTKEKPYACNECNYSAAQKSNLNIHRRIHTKEKPYSCKECNYSTARKNSLVRHMTIHTKKTYARKECNFSAAQKTDLDIHMRTQTKENP